MKEAQSVQFSAGDFEWMIKPAFKIYQEACYRERFIFQRKINPTQEANRLKNFLEERHSVSLRGEENVVGGLDLRISEAGSQVVSHAVEKSEG